MTTDAFGTAALRGAVLEAWRASPARLREDANTEEDHARGYYRDRVLVELAQNAADAATRAGVPGRLLLRLATTDDGTAVLVAANTGAPLDAAGVASLASLRASAKRDAGTGTVGRFGVGFAAVRAVADEVTVCSTTGAVRFSLADTRELLEGTAAQEAAHGRPGLADEVRRRDGSLPALRLPWPTEGPPPTGYDTAVVLQLRDEVVRDEVRALLDGVDDVLLLALPGLVEVVVDVEDAGPRRLADVTGRWDVLTAEGEVPLALVADRPVEERAARAWRVTWARPRDGSAVPGVVHAPTPTDEPCSLPAVLVATLPLDPSRRHVVPGPLTDAVLDSAAQAYAQLVGRAAAEGADATAWVPTGLAAGAVDAALRERVVAALVRTPLLVPASPQDALVPPLRATLVRDLPDGPAVTALGALVAGLVRVPPSGLAAARALGVEERALAEVVDELPTGGDVDWPALYDALDVAAQDATAREGLASLPVPLADGRVVRGPRGVVLLDDDVAGVAPRTLEVLRTWGLRVADPAVVRPLLARLGARRLDAAALLAHPALRAAVLGQADDDDLDRADEVTAAVLDVVAAAGTVPADAVAWLGLLTLDAADGEPAPAHGLVLPGGPAARLLDDRVLAPVALDAVDRWGRDVLVAVGVRDDLVVTTVPDVVAGVAPDDDADDAAALAAASLDGWADYVDELADALGAGAYCGDVPAVADLDAVDDRRWPEVLAHLARTPDLRAALVTSVRGEGTAATAPSYTAWWLRTRADLALPEVFALPGSVALPAALVPPVPEVLAGLDEEALRALGGVGSLADVPAARWAAVLDLLGPVGGVVPLDVAGPVWRAWAQGAGPDEPPAVLPALTAPGVARLVDDAVVADDPRWWQCAGAQGVAVVPVPVAPGSRGAAGVAELLDLPLASWRLGADDDLSGAGEPEDVPDALLALLPDAPAQWWRHDDLRVVGAPVGWWVTGTGTQAQVHAVHVAGLASALAWATGRWAARGAVETLLTDPDDPDAALGLALE
ncbi:sacsin N-terminal ATP-binding-like domain-containing protein [Cellulomonas wangsupingiae]|uniref:ATP-binding protein n=1 Tax=Cellulomonas wangsupingiae TaxID=2968085 RepID=A0ABY5K638_9CELL|nr:ATP-binding protein [Cellulomonas wangsupingiae]MCC2334221.1 ATP-binding protein [Cellulomonas wangsupingiae]UUI65899.1 ATP-binding protein [Cellulomonas wangsupingiae]